MTVIVEAAIEADAVSEFDLGNEAGFDPQPDADLGRSGDLTTRTTSWWHTDTCGTCGQTFRRGDRVRVDAFGGVDGSGGTVEHLDPTLRCASSNESDPDGRPASQHDVEVTEFLDGLYRAFPIRDGIPVRRSDDEPGLLSPPLGGLPRKHCLVCAHTFRRNELVVVCPCHPHNPRCRATVHRDPGQGLVCWDRWRPGGRVRVCPIELQAVDD